MNQRLAFVGFAIACLARLRLPADAQAVPKEHLPVIDMHLHALPVKGWPGGWDALGLMQQLGVVPTLEKAKAQAI